MHRQLGTERGIGGQKKKVPQGRETVQRCLDFNQLPQATSLINQAKRTSSTLTEKVENLRLNKGKKGTRAQGYKACDLCIFSGHG